MTASRSLVGALPTVELERRVRAAFARWCDLDERLRSSGGMLPSPRLAGDLLAFFEADYWAAVEAQEELVRRQALIDLPRFRARLLRRRLAQEVGR